MNADAVWSPLLLGVAVNGLFTLKWVSAGADCAEVSSPASDADALWAVLPPWPSSAACQAVFVVGFPGTWLASALVPVVVTDASTAAEPLSCSAAASVLNAPVYETAPAGAPLMTWTVPLSVGVSAILCEIGLNPSAAPELTVDESDPETVPVMSTAVSFPLIVRLDVLPLSGPATAVSSATATATAVLSATMMPSSAAAAAKVAFGRLLAVSVTVADVAFV